MARVLRARHPIMSSRALRKGKPVDLTQKNLARRDSTGMNCLVVIRRAVLTPSGLLYATGSASPIASGQVLQPVHRKQLD
jgi:hypothetical protein